MEVVNYIVLLLWHLLSGPECKTQAKQNKRLCTRSKYYWPIISYLFSLKGSTSKWWKVIFTCFWVFVVVEMLFAIATSERVALAWISMAWPLQEKANSKGALNRLKSWSFKVICGVRMTRLEIQNHRSYPSFNKSGTGNEQAFYGKNCNSKAWT